MFHVAAVVVLVLVNSAAGASASTGLDPCVPADLREDAITFRTEDDLGLPGLVLGSGSRGVLLVPDVTEEVCDWLPLARRFEDDGYQVLLHQGRTDDLAQSFRFDRDVAAAARELERRGATSIVAGGAGTGATALAAVAHDLPAVDALFLLSPLARTTLGGHVLDAATALDELDLPVFIAASEDDRLDADAGQERPAVDDARLLADAALFSTLDVVPGEAHAAELVADGGPVRDRLVRYVEETVPPPGFPLWLPVGAVALALLLVPAVMLYRGRRAVRRLPDLGGPRVVELDRRP